MSKHWDYEDDHDWDDDIDYAAMNQQVDLTQSCKINLLNF